MQYREEMSFGRGVLIEVRHLLGTVESFLLRALEKVKVTKGPKHSYGLYGHICDVKA